MRYHINQNQVSRRYNAKQEYAVYAFNFSTHKGNQNTGTIKVQVRSPNSITLTDVGVYDFSNKEEIKHTGFVAEFIFTPQNVDSLIYASVSSSEVIFTSGSGGGTGDDYARKNHNHDIYYTKKSTFNAYASQLEANTNLLSSHLINYNAHNHDGKYIKKEDRTNLMLEARSFNSYVNINNHHYITENDGGGNFNIRIGHKMTGSGQVATENGYAMHMSWAHENVPTPSYTFRLSNKRYQEGEIVNDSDLISSVSVTVGGIDALSVKENGVLLQDKYVLKSEFDALQTKINELEVKVNGIIS